MIAEPGEKTVGKKEEEEEEEQKRRKPVFGWLWGAPWRTAALAALLFHVLLVILFMLLVVLAPPGRGDLFRITLRRPDMPGEESGAKRGGDNRNKPREMEQLESRVEITESDRIVSRLVEKKTLEKTVRVARPEAVVARPMTGAPSARLMPPRAGASGGPSFGPGSSIYAGRSNRRGMASRYGGTRGSESAVDKGLGFLARHQSPDGSWDSPGNGKSSGITGLCMLAFLGAGHKADSRDKYGNVITRAATFLIDTGADGLFINSKTVPRDRGGQFYSHCIATLALAEAASVGGYGRGRSAARTGVDTILKAQKVAKPSEHRGGWRYSRVSADSDLSVTGWAIMALIGGRHAGASVPRVALNDAARYVKGRSVPDGFNYVAGGKGAGLAMTASGALSMQFCGYGNDPSVAAALKTVKASRPAPGSGADYYYIYYATQAMFQKGGVDWQYWNSSCRDYLVELQDKDGGWPLGLATGEAAAGRYYSTALSVLTLEVYYRYLQLYEIESAIGGAL